MSSQDSGPLSYRNSKPAIVQDENTYVVQLKPILEAQEKHGPIFRRELFDVAYAAHLSINDKDLNEQTYTKDHQQNTSSCNKVTLLDIYSTERRQTVTMARDMIGHDGKRHMTRRIWIYSDLQHLGYYYGQGKHDRLLPFAFGFTGRPVAEQEDLEGSEFRDKAMQWRSEWEASEVHHNLTTFLRKHARDAAQRIDQIVCFGLGTLTLSDSPRYLRRNYVQHLAACTIRDIFSQEQDGAIPKVYAQDPIYKSSDIAFISEQFEMTILPDPEGFKILDGHTFVITIAPNVPVRQIAIDMTADTHGPAGFLCDGIHSDGLEGDGKDTKQVYQGENMVYYTCNTSPSLWKYKHESIWVEHDDRDEFDYFANMGVYLKKRG
jgi:hypothetical protein